MQKDERGVVQALGRRAVACKHWRWLPGMLASDGHRLGAEDCDGLHPEAYDVVPDFSDPATRGCLLELVREAWGGEVVITEGNGWWSVVTDHMTWDDDNTTSFVAALMVALEAAP